jgi:hypothetical protein
LLKDLGMAAYADYKGTGTEHTTDEAARIVAELRAYEAEYGPLGS